ncbi:MULTISPECIES: hypothetical protein [Psychrilyobacter]|uniref:DUF2513 domain-containing protein n=1 Tax=Psychrilyobacter piezotolerans TaxID=2293438 RepID=A0ABX9KJI7_9FUSO|nr:MULTISPECIES: hypothetical protein [Psychrilyobacter]MCS5421881.1 hypothetical protein [Psychrilyobacter sp. S5]NDI76964.1 hypothetical protein [Psychrilyobacter piezotolerans]RDE64584.1 hypothetical protein DV867_03320 [Psychrilyobacter sp. S5]REI42396.1 hypothetical protein DYH56_03320 [Psychrilyobacter piezotolerans]
MDYSKIILNDLEKQILKLLSANKVHPNIDHIYGYLKFPNYDELSTALHNLKKINFLHEYTIQTELYCLTKNYEQYAIYQKQLKKKNFIKFILGISSAVIAGLLLKIIAD